MTAVGGPIEEKAAGAAVSVSGTRRARETLTGMREKDAVGRSGESKSIKPLVVLRNSWAHVSALFQHRSL